MSKSQTYNENFYNLQAEGSYKSSKEVIKELHKLPIDIKSVADTGCGVGTWLKAWKESGVDNIKGFDANELDNDLLYVDRKHIDVVDFETFSPKTDNLRFDLVESLEVAEHLPAAIAQDHVDLLTDLSDVVLFSAAIPGQGGVGHINENTPQYWNELFKNNGYVCFDILRSTLWDNESVKWWYRQNMMLYVSKDVAEILRSNGYKETASPMDIYRKEMVEDLEWYKNKYKKQKNKPYKKLLRKIKNIFG